MLQLQIEFLSITCQIALKRMPQNTIDDKATIGFGNALVPSGNEPLPEQLVTHIYVAICSWPYGVTGPQRVNY